MKSFEKNYMNYDEHPIIKQLAAIEGASLDKMNLTQFLCEFYQINKDALDGMSTNYGPSLFHRLCRRIDDTDILEYIINTYRPNLDCTCTTGHAALVSELYNEKEYKKLRLLLAHGADQTEVYSNGNSLTDLALRDKNSTVLSILKQMGIIKSGSYYAYKSLKEIEKMMIDDFTKEIHELIN